VYDGTNFLEWHQSVEKSFITRRARWLLTDRLTGDDELNEIALSVLLGSLSSKFKHLLRNQTSFPIAFKALCDHADIQMKARLDILRREISTVTQSDRSVADYIDHVSAKHDAFLRAGGQQTDAELVDLTIAGLSAHFLGVKQQHLIARFKSMLSLTTVLMSVETVTAVDSSASYADVPPHQKSRQEG
jgi:hypothetical protein